MARRQKKYKAPEKLTVKSFFCGTCAFYESSQEKLTYPNCDNEKIGWVRCGAGNIVKKNSVACANHPANHGKMDAEAAQGVVSFNKETLEASATPKKKTSNDGLMGGTDFESQLLDDINAMAAKR